MIIIHSLKYFFLSLLGPYSFSYCPHTSTISSYSLLLFLIFPTLSSCLSTFILFGISCSLMILNIIYALSYLQPIESPQNWLPNYLLIIYLWKSHSIPISSMESFNNKSIFQLLKSETLFSSSILIFSPSQCPDPLATSVGSTFKIHPRFVNFQLFPLMSCQFQSPLFVPWIIAIGS